MDAAAVAGETPVSSPFKDQILAAHVWQGTSNDCGPFCASMLIRAATGIQIDPTALARSMDRITWNGIFPVVRRIPSWATFPWGVVDVLRRSGIAASWRLFTPESRLRAALARGLVPVLFIGSWKPLWGHVMILLAWDPEGGWGFANPAVREKQLFWLKPEVLKKVWSAYGRAAVMVDLTGRIAGPASPAPG